MFDFIQSSYRLATRFSRLAALAILVVLVWPTKTALACQAILGIDRFFCPSCITECNYADDGLSLDSITPGRDTLPHRTPMLSWHLMTCPSCDYTNFLTHFPKKLYSTDSSGSRERPKTRPKSRIRRIEQFAKLQSIEGSSAENMGFLWLKAAWLVRVDENPVKTLLSMKDVRQVQERLDSKTTISPLNRTRAFCSEMAKKPKSELEDLRIVAAYEFCSQGEYQELLARPDLPQEGVEATLKRERQYLSLALSSFETALSNGEVTGSAEADTLYLLGELQRRLGHYESAQIWYQRALEHPQLRDSLRTWVIEQMAEREPVVPAQNQAWVPTLSAVVILLVFSYWLRREKK